jgi:hypothetical protein
MKEVYQCGPPIRQTHFSGTTDQVCEDSSKSGQTIQPKLSASASVCTSFQAIDHCFSQKAGGETQQEAFSRMHYIDSIYHGLEERTPFLASFLFFKAISHVPSAHCGVLDQDFEKYWASTNDNFVRLLRSEQSTIPEGRKKELEEGTHKAWEKIQLLKAKDSKDLLVLKMAMEKSSVLASHLRKYTYFGPTSEILRYATLVQEVVHTVGVSLYDSIFALLLRCGISIPSPLSTPLCERFVNHVKEYLTFEPKEFVRDFFYYTVLSPMAEKDSLPEVPSEAAVENFLQQPRFRCLRNESSVREYRKALHEYLPALCLFIRELHAEERRILAMCVFQTSDGFVEALTREGLSPHKIHLLLSSICPEIVCAIHKEDIPYQISAKWMVYFGNCEKEQGQKGSFERVRRIFHDLQMKGLASQKVIATIANCFYQLKINRIENKPYSDPFSQLENQ